MDISPIIIYPREVSSAVLGSPKTRCEPSNFGYNAASTLPGTQKLGSAKHRLCK